MKLREIMTAGVVTAGEEDEIRHVASLMRDRKVGSVVVVLLACIVSAE